MFRLITNVIMSLKLIYSLEKRFNIPIRVRVPAPFIRYSKGMLLFNARTRQPVRIHIMLPVLFDPDICVLVLAHELGHSQHPQGVCDDAIASEFNAWIWALSFLHGGGGTLTLDMYTSMLSGFSSYYDPQTTCNKLMAQLISILTDKAWGVPNDVQSFDDVSKLQNT